MFKETDSVAAAGAFGILQLRTNLSTNLTEQDESYRGSCQSIPAHGGAGVGLLAWVEGRFWRQASARWI